MKIAAKYLLLLQMKPHGGSVLLAVMEFVKLGTGKTDVIAQKIVNNFRLAPLAQILHLSYALDAEMSLVTI